jgi:UDP-N-acetylmuramyl tripeptide synthase
MFPLTLTFWLAKCVQIVIKRFGRGGGTALPGLIASRLNQRLLVRLAQQLQGTIVVAGTNGKTTTSRLLSSYIEGSGARVVHNRTGSNLTRGIMSTLIAEADWHMHIQADWGLFEVDEAVFASIVSLLKPQYAVALNLFRDQLDRYGEVDAIATKWRAACTALPASTTLLLNADDPLIASLGQQTEAQVVYFGVDFDGGTTEVATYADSRLCPLCGRRLVFSRISYSHLGAYTCPSGDFGRPELQVATSAISLKGMTGSSFTLKRQAVSLSVNLGLAGLYNIYNVTAAMAMALQLGLAPDMLLIKTNHFQAVFGRLEKVEIAGISLTLILVKNPTGYNQVIQTLTSDDSARCLWLVLNDRFADGRDVSWIWDVEFEQLAKQARQTMISGTRAYDLAVRIKYAAFGHSPQVTPSLSEGLRQIVHWKQPVYCLCTYTGMLELRRLLQKQHAVASYHQL